jgi:hypothetical protein
MAEEQPGFREPEQDPNRIDSVALCLRTSFAEASHGSLGDDVIRLLLHLSREPTPKASAPIALPRAMSNRPRLQPSSVATAIGTPRASRTTTERGFMSFVFASDRATVTMVWAWLSVSIGASFIFQFE